MSGIDNTRCEFTREVENSARESRKKAAADWNSPLAAAYAQVSLELRRILERHASKCPICLQEDGIISAITSGSSTSVGVTQ